MSDFFMSNCVDANRLFESDDTFVNLIAQHGWMTVKITKQYFTIEEVNSLCNWEKIFALAFDLESIQKNESGVYRTENHASVGYRRDDEREFFETRLCSNGLSEPNFDQFIQNYSETIVHLYSALNKIASQCLQRIASHLGLDEKVFVDLTDISFNGILPPLAEKTKTNESKSTSMISKTQLPVPAKTTSQRYSSSLLRICKYFNNELGGDSILTTNNNTADHNTPSTSMETLTTAFNTHTLQTPTTPLAATSRVVTFGAHTDSSFLTLALCASVPGLEVVDQVHNKWVCPEISAVSVSAADAVHSNEKQLEPVNDVRVVVFVGEFLQVLTKNRFKACVHRVVNNPVQSPTSIAATDQSVIISTPPPPRTSCPYLVRGLNSAVIDFHNADRYTHSGGTAALSVDLIPDLDGTSMRLLHTMLDLKRQKCFRDNDSRPGNWVLSAYPIERMPSEEEEEEE